MRVLPVLFDAPPWHEGEGQELDKGIHAPPTSGEPLGDFGAALARRYGPSGSFWDGKPDGQRRVSAIRAWQIWNEPNLRQYWGGDPNAREYVRVLETAVKRIKAVDPKAEIVTAGIPQSSLFKAVPLRRYTKQMYKAGAKKWFDTFGLNAYAKNRKDCKQKVDLVRRVMNKRGDRKAKIWITEIGWADTGNDHYLVKGPRGQARQIRKVDPADRQAAKEQADPRFHLLHVARHRPESPRGRRSRHVGLAYGPAPHRWELQARLWRLQGSGRRPVSRQGRFRSPRMLTRNDEKKIWIPIVIEVMAAIARRSSRQVPEASLDPLEQDECGCSACRRR